MVDLEVVVAAEYVNQSAEDGWAVSVWVSVAAVADVAVAVDAVAAAGDWCSGRKIAMFHHCPGMNPVRCQGRKADPGNRNHSFGVFQHWVMIPLDSDWMSVDFDCSFGDSDLDVQVILPVV